MEKAKITMKDKKTGYTLKWFGGHGIHVYDGKREIAFWNAGSFATDHASEEDVRKSMKEVMEEGNYEDYM